jgi:ubiquinone/menaquinone biosynthesis methyltransferase
VRSRHAGPHLSWIVDSAEALPLPDACMDSYTVAFGIRNVPDRRAALREAHRVLRPGGRFMCLEFTPVVDPTLRMLYQPASLVIPAIGRAVANDSESYAYLLESIERFPDAESWADQIQEAGFRFVDVKKTPDQICATHSGHKL